MTRERHLLESSVLEMNQQCAHLDTWLAANESRAPTGELPPPPLLTLMCRVMRTTLLAAHPHVLQQGMLFCC